MTERRYKIIVAPPVQRRMREHSRWWRKHRKGARASFGDALLATYEVIESAPKIGVQYDVEGSELEVWTAQLVTGHTLYFRFISNLPLPPHIRVIGIKGPGEAEPFMAT